MRWAVVCDCQDRPDELGLPVEELHEATDVAGDGPRARAARRHGRVQRRRRATAVGRPAHDHDRASSSSSTTSTSTTTTTVSKDGYVQARPDPDLPRQDIDINLRYPASFTPEQVEVVQAWANYRHVFFATADPPDPDSPLLGRYTTLTRRRDEPATARPRKPARLRGSTVPDVRLRAPRPLARRWPIEDSTLRPHDVLRSTRRRSSSELGCGAVVDDDVLTKLVAASCPRFRLRWLVARSAGTETRALARRQEGHASRRRRR